MPRAFFFPHALSANLKPGRVPFNVHGPLVSRFERRDGDATVHADGYKPNTAGSNQDPCIFSTPLGPFHAFCKIDGKLKDLYVKERGGRHKRLLSHIVSSGDVILYGKFDPKGGDGPTASIWIDTVIVVDEVVRVTTSPRQGPDPCNARGRCKSKRFILKPPWEHNHGPLKAVDRGSDAYVYCLSDAARTGLHCCTNLGDYRIILGRSDPTPAALKELRTSFVPIAEKGPATVMASHFATDTWSKLLEFIDSDIRVKGAGPRGGSWIAEFPDFELARALCNAIIDVKGEVAIPPLKATQPAGRWDPMTGRPVV